MLEILYLRFSISKSLEDLNKNVMVLKYLFSHCRLSVELVVFVKLFACGRSTENTSRSRIRPWTKLQPSFKF